MLTMLIRDFILNMGDIEDAEHFLNEIEKEINKKDLLSYCDELRTYLASDTCSLKGPNNVPHGTKRFILRSRFNKNRSNENNEEPRGELK